MPVERRMALLNVSESAAQAQQESCQRRVEPNLASPPPHR
jgi:hypothetical protein